MEEDRLVDVPDFPPWCGEPQEMGRRKEWKEAATRINV